MPTVRDVAERAGVAPITVSRVLNNPASVRAQTRERVERAIAELHFVPNTLARSLRFRRTNTLALILADITNPFWTTVARGAEDVASQHGYNVIFCNTDENEAKQANYVRVLLQRQVDGFLLTPVRSAPDPVLAIQRQGVPVVVLDRLVPGAQVDIVRFDSVGGAYQLVQYLIRQGHQRIALLSGPCDVSTAVERIAGGQQALRAAGLDERACPVRYGAYTQESGYEMAQEMLRLTPRPTALFTANNFIALGAIKALQEAGRRVPAEMALATMSNLPWGLGFESCIIVADAPAHTMGQRATELLLARLGGDRTTACQDVVLPFALHVHEPAGLEVAMRVPTAAL